jgi:hypothetical protein
VSRPRGSPRRFTAIIVDAIAPRGAIAVVCALAAGGCGAKPAVAPSAPATLPSLLEAGVFDPQLRATVHPPAGWREAEPRVSSNSHQRIWISPSGDTALGVIRFELPLPLGHDLALWGFVQTMRREDGRAELLGKRWDDAKQAMRFEVDGQQYRLDAWMRVQGSAGWCGYVGVLREKPANVAEVEVATEAREAVQIAGE